MAVSAVMSGNAPKGTSLGSCCRGCERAAPCGRAARPLAGRRPPPSPAGGGAGRVRRGASARRTAALHRRPAPPPCTAALHRRPAPRACDVGLQRRGHQPEGEQGALACGRLLAARRRGVHLGGEAREAACGRRGCSPPRDGGEVCGRRRGGDLGRRRGGRRGRGSALAARGPCLPRRAPPRCSCPRGGAGGGTSRAARAPSSQS